MSRVIVIVNPGSGSFTPEFRALIESELQARNVEFAVQETDPEKGGAEIVQQAIDEGVSHLIACGGDGTIMSVVNGLAGATENKAKPPLLSIIPGGTANLLAGALGIPSDVKEAVGVALDGRDRTIDLGRCGEHYFALGVGIGLTERLVSQTSAEEKEKIGKLAYAKAMLAEMGDKPTRFQFKLDDRAQQSTRGVAIVIANAGHIGNGLSFAPDAEMDDELLDLCVLHRFYFRDIVRMIWHSLWGNLPEDRAVSFFQAKRIEIESNPPLDLQVDGEVVDMTTPLVAEILPKALTVRVPVE